MPMAPAGLSPAPPAIIGRRVMPQRCASSLRSRAAGAQPSTSRGICWRDRPVAASAVIRPVPARHIEPQRSRCVRDILDRFTAQAPDADRLSGSRTSVSPQKSQARALAIQSSFGAVNPGIALLPVVARKAGQRCFQDTAHSAADRPSFQRMQGRNGSVSHRAASRRASGPTGRCPRPQPARAVIGLQGVQRRKGRLDPLSAGPARNGRAAAKPIVSARLALATTRCASSTRMVLTAEVPRSMPRYMMPVRRSGDDAATRG